MLIHQREKQEVLPDFRSHSAFRRDDHAIFCSCRHLGPPSPSRTGTLPSPASFAPPQPSVHSPRDKPRLTPACSFDCESTSLPVRQQSSILIRPIYFCSFQWKANCFSLSKTICHERTETEPSTGLAKAKMSTRMRYLPRISSYATENHTTQVEYSSEATIHKESEAYVSLRLPTPSPSPRNTA